ncbi:MAG: hypothetical protein RL514_713 [Verrucomicrobiota bacterium]
MNCPACTTPLTKLAVEGVELDVCHGGCGGLWLDNFELAKFDEPHESAAWEELCVSVDPHITVDYQVKRKCPQCAVPMLRQFCTAQRRTQVDVCPQCGGNCSTPASWRRCAPSSAPRPIAPPRRNQ